VGHAGLEARLRDAPVVRCPRRRCGRRTLVRVVRALTPSHRSPPRPRRRYCFPKPADEAHALAESVLEFEALCGESACAPWYDERRDDRDPRSRALRTCTMWRLLRLHGGAARPNGALLPLTSVTAPDAISPNVLDVALPWHLWHALASLDASGAVFDAACGPGSGAMAPGAHAAYAAQLERSGLWHSALEVMLHLPVVDGAGAAVPHVREAALRELVRRSCPGTPNEWRRNVRGDGAQVSGAAGVALERFEARCDELVRRGCADRTWKIDAIATRARAEGAWRCELCAIVELLEARAAAPGGEARALCARAHGVVIERVLPLLDETAKARLFDRPAPASVDIDAMRAVLDRLSLHLAPHVRRSDRSSDEEGTAVLRSYLSCYGHGPDLDGGVVDRARANAVCAELACVRCAAAAAQRCVLSCRVLAPAHLARTRASLGGRHHLTVRPPPPRPRPRPRLATATATATARRRVAAPGSRQRAAQRARRRRRRAASAAFSWRNTSSRPSSTPWSKMRRWIACARSTPRTARVCRAMARGSPTTSRSRR
jgi:hypothetical protein